MELVYLILPDCLLILLGWLLKNKWHFTPEFFTGLEKLVYFVLFPALMVRSLIKAPISFSNASNLFFICLLLALIGLALTSLLKKAIHPPEKSMASSGQCAYRFNSYIGLSLAPAIASEQSLAIMAILVGFSVPIVNILAVNSMAKQQGSPLVKEILKNPLVLSTLCGLLLNFSGIHLPQVLDSTLDKLARSTIPLGLICVGAALLLQTGTQQGKLLAWITSIRLGIMPIVGIILGFVFGISDIAAQTVILFTALPAASASYILAVRMGGDGRLVAAIISVTTIIAMVTIPIWIYLAKLVFPIVY